MLTSPTVKVHLHLLSKLAYALQEDSFRSTLSYGTCDPAGIIAAAARVEQEIRR